MRRARIGIHTQWNCGGKVEKNRDRERQQSTPVTCATGRCKWRARVRNRPSGGDRQAATVEEGLDQSSAHWISD